MNLLLVSIICSVSVGILFKIKKFELNSFIWVLFCGYFTCFVLGYVLFEQPIELKNFAGLNIFFAFILSFVMPSLFIVLRNSIQQNGIAKTDLVQRMSLMLPIVASFFLFGEQFTWQKLIALIVGFLSILLIMHKKSSSNILPKDIYSLLYIFIGYGFVDIIFKNFAGIVFQNILMIVFMGCMISTLLYISFKKIPFHKSFLLYGIILGGLNFLNIYTYLLAHRSLSESPTIVFTVMNLGVISLGMLIGYFFFKEKINKINIVGLLSAVISILLLANNL